MAETKKIIQNVYILTCDSEGTGGIGTVTIRNDRIASVSYGASQNDMSSSDVELVDGTGKILLPGFVDLHVHGESILLDLLTQGEPESRWPRVEGYSGAEEFWCTDAGREDLQKLYTLVYFLALRSGVTFLGEYGIPGSEEAAIAAVEAFRRTDLAGMLTLHTSDQLELARKERPKGLRFALGLPTAEELTTYNLQASLRHSRESDLPLTVHLGETQKDADILFRNFRKSPIHVLEEFGLLGGRSLLVHVRPQDQQDIDRVKRRGQTCVLSPWSAIRKGADYPALDLFRENGLTPAFCTDWGGFMHWNLLRSAREVESQQSGRTVPALEYLRSLTLRPAELIGMDSEFGSVTPGKRAHLQLVQSRNLELKASLEVMPPESIARLMIDRSSTSDVSDVMVNGEFNVREGTVLTYSEEDILRDLQQLLVRSVGGIRHQPAARTLEHLPPSALPDHDDGLGEEGFKVVRKDEREHVPAAILPLDAAREPKHALPKTIRRVFGDDEL